jgi:hypothetical protein
MGDFSLRHHIEAVFRAHRSSCLMSKEWNVANHTSLYRSSAEGSERLEFRFHHAVTELLGLKYLKLYTDSYRAGNTLHLGYKNQSVNDV